MSPPTNNWRQRRTEHRFYAEIVIDYFSYIIVISIYSRFQKFVPLYSTCYFYLDIVIMPN
jgi:hypothetical protein